MVTGNGKTLRKRETTIDNNTGDVTQIRQYLESGSPATYDMFYDTYGNLDSIVRPQNEKGQRMYFGYSYDPEVTTQTGYGFGEDRAGTTQFRTTVTDANGKISETFTDVKGRQTAVKAPGNT